MIVLVPAGLTLAALAAGIWRRIRCAGATGGLDLHRTPLLSIATLCVALAVAVYAGRAAGVPSSQALEGALLAAGLSALPLCLYYVLGYRVRRLWLLAACWLLSLVPLGYYLLIGGLSVAAFASCPPGSYECPV